MFALRSSDELYICSMLLEDMEMGLGRAAGQEEGRPGRCFCGRAGGLEGLFGHPQTEQVLWVLW